MSKKNRRKPEKNQNSAEKLAAKKAAVLGKNKKRNLMFPIVAVTAVVAVMAVGGYMYVNGGIKGTAVVTAQETQKSNGTQYVYPVGMFDDGIARHFEHTDGNITIKYFVLKSSDGVIRAAFDACDVCWPAGKGYYQDGDVMVCRNCGRRFASVKVNEVKGGCNPAPLNRHVSNGSLTITFTDILDGKSYFDFSKRSKS